MDPAQLQRIGAALTARRKLTGDHPAERPPGG